MMPPCSVRRGNREDAALRVATLHAHKPLLLRGVFLKELPKTPEARSAKERHGSEFLPIGGTLMGGVLKSRGDVN